jgi:hypothetical protein
MYLDDCFYFNLGVLMGLFLRCRYKLKNIEETEAAKKLLQEKRLMVGRTKSDFSIPSSYSADYFQRGRDYAEKLRKGNNFLDSFNYRLHRYIYYLLVQHCYT